MCSTGTLSRASQALGEAHRVGVGSRMYSLATVESERQKTKRRFQPKVGRVLIWNHWVFLLSHSLSPHISSISRAFKRLVICSSCWMSTVAITRLSLLCCVVIQLFTGQLLWSELRQEKLGPWTTSQSYGPTGERTSDSGGYYIFGNEIYIYIYI